MTIFYVEGPNSSGKSTLLQFLAQGLGEKFNMGYSIPEVFLDFYKQKNVNLNNESKFLLFCAAGLSKMEDVKNSCSIIDRSIISTMAAFLATNPDAETVAKRQDLCDRIIEIFPKPSGVILLEVDEKTRMERILQKEGTAREEDLKSIKDEEKKNQFRENLLLRYGYNTKRLNTTNLSKEDVGEEALSFIRSHIERE